MPRVSSSKVSFNAGELSPLLEGRTDTDIYARGCRTLTNFIPTTQGAAIKRLGTKYVSAVKNAAHNTRLIPFIFSEIDSYVLEFGDQYIRFYQGQAQVGYEIATPYLESEVFDIKFAQIGDIMYLTHPNHFPQKISRFGATNWTIADMGGNILPVLDRPASQTITMEVTGTLTVGSSVTVTASGSSFGTGGLGFQDGHIGSTWAFAEASDSLSPYGEWTASSSIPAFTYIRRDGRLYYSAAGGTTGTFPPIHEDGTVSDGGVDWLFINFGVGYAKMTARTSATVATFEVKRHLPPTIQTGSPQFEATTYWNEAAWSDVQGYPRAVTIHEERLFFGGTTEKPLVIDGSRSNRRFEDFDPAQAEDDAALRYELSGRVNTIQWLVSDSNFLLAGTYGGVAFLGSGNASEPLTPTNVKANNGSSFGSNSIQAVELYNNIQYIQKQGKRVYQTEYDDLTLKYKAIDMSVNNPEIGGDGFVQIAKQEEPYVVLWCVREDGVLAGLVQENNQSVLAWTKYVTGLRGDDTFDKFKSAVVIPSSSSDELWVIVERNVDGGTVKYVEYLESTQENHYVDSGIKYSGAAATTITGLAHLENEDVDILADGAVVARQAVSGGQITLSIAASEVHVGRPFNADLEPMLLDGGSANGTAQTKTKRIHEIGLRLYRTLGLKSGQSFDKLTTIPFRRTPMVMDSAPNLFGSPRPDDIILATGHSWGNGNMAIRSDLPLPCTIISINPRYVTNDK
jgi:hypothetical protein